MTPQTMPTTQYVDPSSSDIFVGDEEAAKYAKKFTAPVQKLPKLYCIGHVDKVLEVKTGTNYSFVHFNLAGDFTSLGARYRMLYYPHWFAPDADLKTISTEAKSIIDTVEKGAPEYAGASSVYYTINNHIMGSDRPSGLEALTGPFYGHFMAGLARIDVYDNDAMLVYCSKWFSAYGPILAGYKLKQSSRDGELTKYYETDGWWHPKTRDGKNWNTAAFKAHQKQVEKGDAKISYDLALIG